MGNFLSSLFGSSQTSTYQPPEELKNAVTDLLKRAGTQSQQPYPEYTPATAAQYSNYVPGMVAPMTPNQAAAGQSIAGLQGYTAPNFAAATGLAGAASSPIQLQQFGPQAINQYMSPYLSNVLGAAVANINQTNAQQQQQVLGNAIQRGAFGGDRAGIAQAELARQQNLANNATIANLLNQGYGQAQQQFNTQQAIDAAAQLQNRQLMSNAALNLANLGMKGQEAALQQAQAQYGYGTAEQQQQQAGLSTAYQQFLNKYAYPYQQLGWYSQLASGTAPALGGSTTQYSPTTSPMGIGLGSLIGLGALTNPNMQSSNPFAYANAGMGAIGSGLSSIFGLFKDGGRVGYAEGGPPTNESIQQAYNDYINAISSGASYADLKRLYDRYQQSFKNALLPSQVTPVQPAAKADLPAEKAVPTSATTGAGGGGGGGGEDRNVPTTVKNAVYSPDYTSSNGPVGDVGGYGPYYAGGGPGNTFNQGSLGDLGKGLGQALSLMSPFGILSALNRDPKVVAEEMGKMYAEPNRVAAAAYDDAGNPIDFTNTASGQNLAEYMAQMGIEDPSQVRMGMTQVNGRWQPEFFKDSTIGRMLHPNSVPALDVPGVTYGSDALSKVGKEGEGFAIPGVDSGSSTALLAAAGDQSKFFDLIRPYAEDVSSRTGIDPRVIMAQAALESAYGKSAPGGNLFGIKSSGGNLLTTKEFVPGQGEVETKASFAKFPDLASTFRGYEDLMSNPRYAGVLSGQTLADQIKALGQSGYATDPDYASKIRSIANRIDFGTPSAPQAPGVSYVRQAEQPGQRLAETAVGSGRGAVEGPGERAAAMRDSGDRGGRGEGSGNWGSSGATEARDSGGTSQFGVDRSSYGGPNESTGESRTYGGGSQSFGIFKRGGLIHKARGGGFEPITMQYGLPTEEMLQQAAQSFAGSGAGTLPVTATALATKGVLPSKRGGRIHAKNGAGINIAGYPEGEPNPATEQADYENTLNQIIAGESNQTMGGPMRRLSPIQPGSQAPRIAEYQARQVTPSLEKNAEEVFRTQPQVPVQPEFVTQQFPARPDYVGKNVMKAPAQIDANQFFEGEKPAPVREPAPAAPAARTEPQVPSRYMSKPPADMMNLAALQFAAQLMSPGAFGTNLANAASNYARTIMAQQNQQREQMEAEQRTKLSQAQEMQQRKIQQPTGLGEVYEGPEGQLLVREVPLPGSLPGLPGMPGAPTTQPQQITAQDQNLGPIYVGNEIPVSSANKTQTLQQMGFEYKKQGLGSNATALSKSYEEMASAAQQEATAAQNTATDLATAVQAVTNLGSSQYLQPGAAIGLRSAIANYINALNNIVGGPLDFQVTAENLASQQVLGKISTLQAQAQQKGLGREAGFWLNTLKQAYPNEEMTKEAANKLMASMIVSNTRAKERAGVYTVYGNYSGRMGVDAPQAFEAVNPGSLYAADTRAITDMLNRTRDVNGKPMNMITALQQGLISRKTFDEFAKKMYGTTNLSRHF